ncbi:hypothetical protein [Chamaesiphon minutus]|uniref:Uncharacterized protein n=1 Tax=Chamaesiphon minutus (strain ATCC 27169 / PCC 6605) TaxID=1173020 RepID=K9UJB3_CHAP6|nr:hypothetical protein [Chamaesiphon minutus]AFY94269.1 hypothetical protein Cha6605_3260 [Chamaesiphon minutus PCC 6605]
MAIAKKGTRLITVDDIEYRWIVQPDDEPGLGIVVECAENPGQRMITWVEHGNIISPWLVRKAILHALDRGWKPKQRGQELNFGFEGILQNPRDWIGVPAEYQEQWQLIYYESHDSQESLNLSAPYPICGTVSLHHWYQVGTPIDRVFEGHKFIANGYLWQWCSNCHSFEHYSSFVPDWWSCALEVDAEKLTAWPIAIEEARIAMLTSNKIPSY